MGRSRIGEDRGVVELIDSSVFSSIEERMRGDKGNPEEDGEY